MDQGLPTTYVMLVGESFQLRDLGLDIDDGEWVEVKGGLRFGERLVPAPADATTVEANHA